MKEQMKRVLYELLKDSSRNDRELAKVLGVSQPTIGRMKGRLLKEGIIKEFTVIPDFEKLGYEIMAITVAKAKTTLTPKEQEKAMKLMLVSPNVIFVASAIGMGMNGVMISLHKDYSDFNSFMKKLMQESGGYMEKIDSMLVGLKSQAIVKPLSLAYLAKREEI